MPPSGYLLDFKTGTTNTRITNGNIVVGNTPLCCLVNLQGVTGSMTVRATEMRLIYSSSTDTWSSVAYNSTVTIDNYDYYVSVGNSDITFANIVNNN